MRDANLVCPLCKRVGGILLNPAVDHVRQVVCSICSRELPVVDGIPDFAPHVPMEDPKARTVQKLNCSPTFARLYESLVWRKVLTRLGAGLSMGQEVREVLEAGRLQSLATIVDLACGTGHYARAYRTAYPDARVYGLDVSMPMLVKAGIKARQCGCGGISFLRGDLYEIPFGDGTMDLVNCCGVLHLFSDLEPVWREVARVLRPGGVFTGWVLIALPRWGERKFQERLMKRGEATFFQPSRMKSDFERAGLSGFRWAKRRAWLIFRVQKPGRGG
ncbi:putative Methyltransferase type 11 [uncultured Desulfatiglans sp.]|uniref:Putative Methyltransferase type 11 n=1 Tax=Uncultured Desulfatiglans sp. TaxID=1748965 RepID=A0A653AGZ9_UNCDX|nr:putative Methyltransferase type 11 [uncultured Desulfatiglans sp.]